MSTSCPIELSAWTELKERVAKAVQFDRAVCLTLAVFAAVAVTVSGLVFVNSPARWSSLLYGPLIGWGFWVVAHGRIAERQLRAMLSQLRRAVSPTLVPSVTGRELVRLVLNDAVPVGPVRLQISASERAIRVEGVDLEIPPPNLGQIYLGGSGQSGSSG